MGTGKGKFIMILCAHDRWIATDGYRQLVMQLVEVALWVGVSSKVSWLSRTVFIASSIAMASVLKLQLNLRCVLNASKDFGSMNYTGKEFHSL